MGFLDDSRLPTHDNKRRPVRSWSYRIHHWLASVQKGNFFLGNSPRRPFQTLECGKRHYLNRPRVPSRHPWSIRCVIWPNCQRNLNSSCGFECSGSPFSDAPFHSLPRSRHLYCGCETVWSENDALLEINQFVLESGAVTFFFTRGSLRGKSQGIRCHSRVSDQQFQTVSALKIQS